MRIFRSIWPCIASVLLLVGCENDVPSPEPAAPRPSAAAAENKVPAAPAAQPESANCCGAEMCKRVPGGCGCRKGGDKNANCGG